MQCAETILKSGLSKINGLIENIRQNLAKTGNTPFVADEIEIDFSEKWFFIEPLVGFEPTTPRLQIMCSDQQS